MTGRIEAVATFPARPGRLGPRGRDSIGALTSVKSSFFCTPPLYPSRLGTRLRCSSIPRSIRCGGSTSTSRRRFLYPLAYQPWSFR